MATSQLIYREGSMDCGHRVLDHPGKCMNPHGHTYLYHLQFEYARQKEIGYALDFGYIKTVGVEFLETFMDHGNILNPSDEKLKDIPGKKWFMSLNGEGIFCNPTVENIAKEIFLAFEILFAGTGVRPHTIEIKETPKCGTICTERSISPRERGNFLTANEARINEFLDSLNFNK